MDNDLLTVQQAADRRHCSVDTIYVWIRNGQLAAQLRYGRVVVAPADVDAVKPAKVGRPKLPVAG